MPERNNSLLLSNAAAPAAGINKTKIIQWYGGPLTVTAIGVFGGATVDIMACTRLPTKGDRADYNNAAKFTDADFSVIATTSAPGTVNLGNVNPCALALRVTNPGTTSRIRVTVG